MTEVTHDPKVKKLIRDTLTEYLYQPIMDFYQKDLNSLIQRNDLIGNHSDLAFSYRGVNYVMSGYRPPKRFPRLDPSLHSEMDEYLKEITHLKDNEMPHVIGFILRVMNTTNELHDYLRVFPEAIHDPIKNIINSCPCRGQKLTDDQVNTLIETNKKEIGMVKSRLSLNMII